MSKKYESSFPLFCLLNLDLYGMSVLCTQKKTTVLRLENLRVVYCIKNSCLKQEKKYTYQ